MCISARSRRGVARNRKQQAPFQRASRVRGSHLRVGRKNQSAGTGFSGTASWAPLWNPRTSHNPAPAHDGETQLFQTFSKTARQNTKLFALHWFFWDSATRAAARCPGFYKRTNTTTHLNRCHGRHLQWGVFHRPQHTTKHTLWHAAYSISFHVLSRVFLVPPPHR